MHILYVLTRAANGCLYADLFRELSSYLGYPDASLAIGDKTYFVHFIHRSLGALDEPTRREAVDLVTKRLEVLYSIDSQSILVQVRFERSNTENVEQGA